MSIKTTVGSYKGNPTISLDPDSKYPFTFGVKKAEMILEALPAIQEFVKRYGRPAAAPDRVNLDYEDRCAEQCGLTQPGM